MRPATPTNGLRALRLVLLAALAFLAIWLVAFLERG